jgi:hypothetical protein
MRARGLQHTSIDPLGEEAQAEADDTGGADDKAEVIQGPEPDQDRHRGEHDSHLEHRDRQREFQVLLELRARFGFERFGLALDLLLFGLVALNSTALS